MEETFLTAVAPGSFARRQNEYYETEEEFVFALGEALRQERWPGRSASSHRNRLQDGQ